MCWDMKKVSRFDFLSDITHYNGRIIDYAIGECSMHRVYKKSIQTFGWKKKNRRVLKKRERVAVY